MYQPANPSLWQGRIDHEEQGDTRRFHQVMQFQPDPETTAALLGFCCDAGVRRNQGRTGAAAGPEAIRRALANLSWRHSGGMVDAGDVHCEQDQLEAAQVELAQHIGSLLAKRIFPIVLGGGHEVAYGSWLGLANHIAAVDRDSAINPRIGILNLDAHFDLRQASQANSGTPFKQIADACNKRGWRFSYAVFGIAPSANTNALFERAEQLKVWYSLDSACSMASMTQTQALLTEWLSKHDIIYLTICMDVFPASEAPGVSAPAVLGIEPRWAMAIIETVVRSNKLALIDIAETNPSLDQDQRTAKLAARLIWHILASRVR